MNKLKYTNIQKADNVELLKFNNVSLNLSARQTRTKSNNMISCNAIESLPFLEDG